MSDDESTISSSDESENIQVTGLVATRAKRRGAGNLYETLRQNLDDEELQKELLAEDELEDAEDYQSSEVEDDEDALDSSSDSDDAGPPKEGEAEDLAGEKELLKAERMERSKKRKAQEAKLKVPAWHKAVKKVKLADDAKTEDGNSSLIEVVKKVKKVKKSERDRRASEDGPVRQSIRASAVASRETVQANLLENAERAKKQKKTHSDAVKKSRANRYMDLTLEQRLEKCQRIEKETAKQLGRFEREEAERVRLREEALLAKRRKALDGPLIRTVSTSALYQNGKLKIKRLEHGSQDVDEIMQAEAKAEKAIAEQEAQEAEEAEIVLPSTTGAAQEQSHTIATEQPTKSEAPDEAGPQAAVMEAEPSATTDDQADVSAMSIIQPDQLGAGEEEHNDASMVETVTRRSSASSSLAPGTAEADKIVAETASQEQSEQANALAIKPEQSELQSAFPASRPTQQDQQNIIVLNPEQIPAVPEPILLEQAQRSVLILESFAALEAQTGRRNKAVSALEPTPVAQILLPESYPSFNDDEATYLRKNRKLKQEILPKQKCALTTWPGKYRDPKTGVVYADVAAYKMLQRMIAGGCAWSDVLECWTGPSYGKMGRPAIGVPEGFDREVEPASIVKAEI